MIYTVEAISTGKIEELHYSNKRPMRSALNKTPFSGFMWLSQTGFTQDEQEYKDHGGPDKAVCIFSKSNYTMWQDDVAQLPSYAMFGENLTVTKLDEHEAYFGNQYQLGGAIIEVSEIREPCWKIQSKYQIPDLVKRMSTSGKTGFYCRVIQEGYVADDDHLKLIKTAEEDTKLSVYELNDIYYNDRKNARRLRYALQNPYITENRKDKLHRLLTRAQN